jgi:hypothetical protein
MKKPKKRAMVVAYNWHECVQYIEKKYKIDIRDYAGKFKCKWNNGELGEEKPYQDFWHWVVQNKDVNNGSVVTLSSYDYTECEDWQQQILTFFLKEFGKGKEATFWVEW